MAEPRGDGCGEAFLTGVSASQGEGQFVNRRLFRSVWLGVGKHSAVLPPSMWPWAGRVATETLFPHLSNGHTGLSYPTRAVMEEGCDYSGCAEHQ